MAFNSGSCSCFVVEVVAHLISMEEDELGGPRRPGTWRPLGLDGLGSCNGSGA